MENNLDLSQLIHSIGEGVIVADSNGNIVFWNPSAERIFGFSAAEALGKTLDIITPERFRQRHWAGYDHSMQTGTTRYGSTLLKVPALHKDGRTLSIAFSVAMLFDEFKKVNFVVAIVRDETERFLEERKLKQRIVELESVQS